MDVTAVLSLPSELPDDNSAVQCFFERFSTDGMNFITGPPRFDHKALMDDFPAPENSNSRKPRTRKVV
jgi:hypothetical protein